MKWNNGEKEGPGLGKKVFEWKLKTKNIIGVLLNYWTVNRDKQISLCIVECMGVYTCF